MKKCITGFKFKIKTNLYIHNPERTQNKKNEHRN